jgi:hypothetical protein
MNEKKSTPKDDSLAVRNESLPQVKTTTTAVVRDDAVKSKNRYLYGAVAFASVCVLIGAYLLRTVSVIWGTAFTVAGTLISLLSGLLTTRIAGEQNYTLSNQGATLLALNEVVNDLKSLTKNQTRRIEETSKDTMSAIREQQENHTAMENTERFFLLDKLSRDIPIVYMRTDLDEQNKEGVAYTPVTEDYAAGILQLLFAAFGRELLPIGVSAENHQLNDKSTPLKEASAYLSDAEQIISFTAHAAVEKAGLDASKYYVWLTEKKIIVETPSQHGVFEDDIAANRYWGFLARITQGGKTFIIMSGPTLRGVALVGAFIKRVIRHEGAMIRELNHPRFLEDTERDILFGKPGKVGEDFAAIINGFFVGKSPIVNESTVKISHIFSGETLLRHRQHNSNPPSSRT